MERMKWEIKGFHLKEFMDVFGFDKSDMVNMWGFSEESLGLFLKKPNDYIEYGIEIEEFIYHMLRWSKSCVKYTGEGCLKAVAGFVRYEYKLASITERKLVFYEEMVRWVIEYNEKESSKVEIQKGEIDIEITNDEIIARYPRGNCLKLKVSQ